MYPSISPSPLYSHIGIFLAGSFRWNVMDIWNERAKKEVLKQSCLVRGRGSDLDLIKFLLLTRVILKRMNFPGDHGTRVFSLPWRCPPMVLPRIPFSSCVPNWPYIASVTLSRDSEYALVVLYDTYVDNVPVVGGVFHDFWDILYGKECGRRGVPRDEINNMPPFKPPPPPSPPPPLLPPPPMSLWSCGMCRTVCVWLNDLITRSVGTLRSWRCSCD